MVIIEYARVTFLTVEKVAPGLLLPDSDTNNEGMTCRLPGCGERGARRRETRTLR